jgi:hypothetical protein
MAEQKTIDEAGRPTPPAPTPAEAEGRSDGEEGNFSYDYVKSLREENKRRRVEAKENALKADSLAAKARGLLIRAAFNDEAAKAGVTHPEDAFKLADLNGVEADLEEESVKGLPDAIESLRKSRPYLFRRDKPRQYGPEATLTGSAPAPLEAARENAMKNPSIKNVARYQAELARAKRKA